MKVMMTTLFLIICLRLAAPSAGALTVMKSKAIYPYAFLWQAVGYVETRNNPTLINEDEQAYGYAQIRQCKIDEFNAATGKHYTLTDCLSEKVNREVFMWHMMQYSDWELAVRRWNGSGDATLVYLDNVKARL